MAQLRGGEWVEGDPLSLTRGMRPRVVAGPRAVGPVTFVRMGVGDE